EGKRLITAARQEALVDQVAQVWWRDTLDDEGIETVEGAKRPQHQPTPLWRFGVDVTEMGKPRGVLGVAVHGNAVHRLGPCRTNNDEASHEKDKGAHEPRQHAVAGSVRGAR